MKEYFVSVIAVSLVGSMLVSLAPNGESFKNIKVLCALCTVACIVFPLVSLFNDGVSAEDVKKAFDIERNEEQKYDEIYNCSLEGYGVLNAESTLKNEIIQTLKINENAFDVRIVLGEENGVIYISLVRFYLYSGGLTVDPRSLETYVLDRLGCGCEFVYDVL